MFCEKCGNQLREGAQFCPKCGTPIKVVESNQDDAVQNQYVNDVPDNPDQQISKKTIDDQPVYQEQRSETDWDDGFSTDLSASDKKPKKIKKPVKWMIIAGVSLVLVVTLVIVAISFVIPLLTSSNSVLQNQNSVLADTSVVENYFTDNLKKEKSELNKCRYYDLKIMSDNFSLLLVQYRKADSNGFEYYFFPSFYGNALDDYRLIDIYSFWKKNNTPDIPLIYESKQISNNQQNGHITTKLQLSIPYNEKPSDVYIVSDTRSGCVDRVVLCADGSFKTWSFDYNTDKQVNKTLFALSKDTESGSEDLINPDVSFQDIQSKSEMNYDYTYDYNDVGELVKASCADPENKSQPELSFEYESNKKRISSACTPTNNEKYVSKYTRDNNGLMKHIHIDCYSNDLTIAENSFDYDISYNGSIKLSETNGGNTTKDAKEESAGSSPEAPAKESEDNDSSEEQDKESDNVDSGEWSSAYYNCIIDNNRQLQTHDKWDTVIKINDDTKLALYDFDNNSIPELCIGMIGAHGMGLDVFSVFDNEVVYIGGCGAGSFTYSDDNAYPGLFAEYNGSYSGEYSPIGYLSIVDRKLDSSPIITYREYNQQTKNRTTTVNDEALYQAYNGDRKNLDYYLWGDIQANGWESFLNFYGYHGEQKQSEKENQNEQSYFTLGGNKISIELPSNWNTKTTTSKTGEDITFTVTETNGRDYTVCSLRCMTESEYERVKEWYRTIGTSLEDAAEYYGNKGDYYYAMVWLDGYGFDPSTQLTIKEAINISRDVAKTFRFCD